MAPGTLSFATADLKTNPDKPELALIAINSRYLSLLDSLPHGVNQRLMSLRLHLDVGYVTLISAYTPTMTHTDETKEQFYEELDKLLQAVPRSDKLVLLGDFSARVRCDNTTCEKVLGRHGIGKMNSNGILLLTTCTQHQLAITNTLFQQRNESKMTSMHPRSGHWHQIDFSIVRQRDISDVHHTRSMLGSTIAFSFKTRRRRVRPAATTKKFDVQKLSSPDVADKFTQKSERALK